MSHCLPSHWCSRSWQSDFYATDAGRQHFADQLTSIRYCVQEARGHQGPRTGRTSVGPLGACSVARVACADLQLRRFVCIPNLWQRVPNAAPPARTCARAHSRTLLSAPWLCSTTSTTTAARTCAPSATSSRRCSTRSCSMASAKKNRWDSTSICRGSNPVDPVPPPQPRRSPPPIRVRRAVEECKYRMSRYGVTCAVRVGTRNRSCPPPLKVRLTVRSLVCTGPTCSCSHPSSCCTWRWRRSKS